MPNEEALAIAYIDVMIGCPYCGKEDTMGDISGLSQGTIFLECTCASCGKRYAVVGGEALPTEECPAKDHVLHGHHKLPGEENVFCAFGRRYKLVSHPFETPSE